MADPTVSILSACGFTLGEGPACDAETDKAFWFDIVNRKLCEHRLCDGAEKVHELPLMASVIARTNDPAGRYLLATETGLQLFDLATGRLEMLCPIEADDPRTRSNDGRVHPSGALWIGTMGLGGEKDAGAVYVWSGGTLHTVEPRWTIPNSLSFSADGRFGYLAETVKGEIWRMRLDPETGLPVGDRRLFADYRSRKGWPDGAIMDADDVLHVAVWGGGRVDRIATGGTWLEPIPIPARQPSCPAFAGRDASHMIVTSARQGLKPDALASDPHAGHTFIIEGGFRGRHDPPVRLG